jgi:hypothetical protein
MGERNAAESTQHPGREVKPGKIEDLGWHDRYQCDVGLSVAFS